MIAFFGMGLLGANFVRALRRRGEAVHVWNRTAEKARALDVTGATAFDDPAEAARGASRVHLTLSADAAVDDVLERARSGFAEGVALVDHTTTSPDGTRERARRWAERGVAFLHAPVFMGPPNALDGTGVMLASGDRAGYDALAPELAKMTGRLVWLGPQPERAATFKLIGNSFLMALTGGIGDMLAIAKAGGVTPAEAVALFDFFDPGAAVGARAKRVLEIDHASWELTMARKDAGLMMDEAARAGVGLTLVPAVAARMDRLIAQGHGADDWTVLAKAAVESNRA